MNLSRMMAATLALLVFALPARAEDEELGDTVVRRTLELPGYRAAQAPAGPRLSVPTDLIAQSGDPSDVGNWQLDQVYENGTWLPFSSPPIEEWALGLDSAAELLDVLARGDREEDHSLEIGTTEVGLMVEGRRVDVERAVARLPWVLDALAPSVRVQAVLSGGLLGRPEQLRAMGRVTLRPNRWTRVYLQEDAVPCIVHWDLEVAQEATTMDPYPADVSEGQELYLRYHPGQSVALVEVWAGSVEHMGIVRQDLSEVRNIPEANGAGVLSYPESAVNRAFTAVVLPSGTPARRELRWTNEGRSSRLVLDFEAPPRPQGAASLGKRGSMTTIRAGAVADELDFAARVGENGAWEDRLSRVYYRVGETYERKGQRFDFSLSGVLGGTLFVLEAPADELDRARQAIQEAEARLVTRPVSLQLVTVPEPAFRQALGEGTVGIGRAVLPETMAALRKAGASVGESVRLPVLMNMRVGFRVGHTVPGVIDLNSEIAQSSGGVHPITSVRFAGLLGEVRLRTTTTGHALRVSGRITWADRSAGEVEMVFRPPVSMGGVAKGTQTAPGKPRKVKLGVLGGGGAPIETEIEVHARDESQHLVHAHVRGSEVVLLLAAVR